MKIELFNNTKVAAYFIWEYTRNENALDLWYCAEDIASYFENSGFKNAVDVRNIVRKPHNEFEYIQLVRHVAFRLYIYTGNYDLCSNWFIAEKLVANGEWLNATLNMANILAKYKDNIHEIGIRSEMIRKHYSK